MSLPSHGQHGILLVKGVVLEEGVEGSREEEITRYKN